MRRAAGILIIVLGVLSFMIPGAVADAIAWGRATSWDEYFSIRQDIGVQIALPTLLLIVFIVGGGICALRKKVYWWALSAAIASVVGGITLFLTTVGSAYFGMMYTPIAVLALVLLVKRRQDFKLG
jgi:hypothetical protein